MRKHKTNWVTGLDRQNCLEIWFIDDIFTYLIFAFLNSYIRVRLLGWLWFIIASGVRENERKMYAEPSQTCTIHFPTSEVEGFYFYLPLALSGDFPCDSVVKNLPASARDAGLIPGLGRFSWRRKWQSTPVFLPGEYHGQRSLASYNWWTYIDTL